MSIKTIALHELEKQGLIPTGPDAYTKEGIAQFRKYLSSIDASYYAAPRDSFNLAEAVDLARREGRTCVVVEDLS